MNAFSLGQTWVSKVTEAELPEVGSIGVVRNPLPDAEHLHAVLRELSTTETAREIARRKWIQPRGIKDKVTERGEALFDFLFPRPTYRPAYVMFRGKRPGAQSDVIEQIATMAWLAHVVDSVRLNSPRVAFKPSNLSDDFFRHLAKLSVREDGPKEALTAIREIGISIVVESGLPGMSVDGASLHTISAGPILALTLRYDRLDNFWFTLLHELGHLALHLNQPSEEVFVDSLDDSWDDVEEAEAEADAFAKDSLIPRDVWLRSDAHRLGTERGVMNLAQQLGIHPSIVAGRIRYERRDFRLFTNLVGAGSVRGPILAGG